MLITQGIAACTIRMFGRKLEHIFNLQCWKIERIIKLNNIKICLAIIYILFVLCLAFSVRHRVWGSKKLWLRILAHTMGANYRLLAPRVVFAKTSTQCVCPIMKILNVCATIWKQSFVPTAGYWQPGFSLPGLVPRKFVCPIYDHVISFKKGSYCSTECGGF